MTELDKREKRLKMTELNKREERLKKIYNNIFGDRSLSPDQHKNLPDTMKPHMKVWGGFIPPIDSIIEINEEDIQEGLRKKCSRCPLVSAAHRAFPNITETIVFDRAHLIFINEKDKSFYSIFGDNPVREWIQRFDLGYEMEPIKLVIKEFQHGFLNIVGA